MNLIDDFNKIHHGKYKYQYDERIKYTKNDKIGIICPIHGLFFQLVRNHRRHGCKKCAMIELRQKNLYTTEKCIEKFKKIHGDRYDYSLVNYVNEKNPVLIVCRIHGQFFMAPKYHWKGWLCQQCGEEQKRQKLRKTTASFIKDSQKIWGSRWNYSKVEYFDGKTPVTISCIDHGDFSIPARHHLMGIGCPRCSSGRSDLEELWLDELGVIPMHRHKRFVFDDGSYLFPDGLDEENKIVYLFMGDYWHGNPEIYPRSKLNPTLNKTFGQIYDETITDIERYRTAGFEVIIEWETNFKPKNRLYDEVRLNAIVESIPDSRAAFAFLDKIIFQDQIRCPYCGGTHLWNSPKPGLYHCLVPMCRKSFNSRTGTFLHASQIPLYKWFYGIYLLKSSRRHISLKALSVRIGVGSTAALAIKKAVSNPKNKVLMARIFYELLQLNKPKGMNYGND